MKIFVTLFAVMLFGSSVAQDLSSDMELIKEHLGVEQKNLVKKKDSFFRGALSFYKNQISSQILNDCIYEQSCSTFSPGSINEYGIFKGVFLSADRLMRCNRLSQNHVLPARFNRLGKISDHWYHYGHKN